MNPIIYACSSREFKRAFKRILLCQFRRRPRVFLNGQSETISSSLDCDTNNMTFKKSCKKYRPLSLCRPSTKQKNNMVDSNRSASIRASSPDSPIRSLRLYQLQMKTYVSDDVPSPKRNANANSFGESVDQSLSATQDSLVVDQRFNNQSGTAVDESSFADDEEYVNSVIVNSRNHKQEIMEEVPGIPLVLIRCDSSSHINETTPFASEYS